MTERLVVAGAGGSGRELLDIVEAAGGYEIVGVVDDSPSDANLQRLRERGIPMLGSSAEWLARGERVHYLIGIEHPPIRSRLDALFRDAGDVPATVVHPAAIIGTRSTFGPGTVIGPGAVISTNVTTGRHVHILANATIGHDTTVGEHSSVWPSGVLSGEVRIGTGVIVGAGALVLPCLTVGDGAFVGAAACVVRDVPPDTVVKGVPAR
jgi:sugar O-acyltransferase (sialic acid O-acetyltransferase NeuD family)